jgi:aryl-alcohol dehydrogenase-like predicted oxidoreductase
MKSTRRTFVGKAAAVTTGLTFASAQEPRGTIPRRRLGATDTQVSIIGMGGFHLGAAQDLETATKMVNMALDSGVNFFDNAWEYHDGKSEEWLGQALGSRRKEAVLMTKVCSHGRKKAFAMGMLEDSLRRLRTDYLDVWQIHEVIYDNDPDLIFAPGGAAEALLDAKKQGKVRLIGFTGHKDPSIHLRMLKQGFPFDTVQMPLNPLDATFRSFERQVLPEALRQKIAVLGMKSMGGSGEMIKSGVLRPDEALRYAMSLPVTVTISGMNDPDTLRQNLDVASKFEAMSEQEMSQLRSRCKEEAGDGHCELFKTTVIYDGAIGREQHGLPPVKELPA